MKITKKAMKRMFVAVCALSMTAACAVPASAGTLTPQELYEKYLPVVTAEKADANAPHYVFYDGTGNTLSEDEVEQEVIEKVSKLEDGSFDTTELEELYGPWWWAKLQHFRMNPWFDVLNPKDGVPQRMFRDCEEENGFHYVVRDDGTANIVGCDVSLLMECDGVFTIPSEIGGVNVTRIENYAFSCTWGQQHNLFDTLEKNGAVFTTLVLPEHLEEIGELAFYWFPPVQVEFPDTLKFIGQLAFAGNVISQDRIVLPDSLEYVGMGGIGDGSSFSELVLPSGAMCGFLDNKRLNDRFNGPHDGIMTTADILDSFQANWLRGVEEYKDYDDAELLPVLLEDSNARFYYTESNQENYYSWYKNNWYDDGSENNGMLGDVSENGKVDIGDAVLLARFLGNDPEILNDITAQGIQNGDINGDNETNSKDLTDLLKLIANAGR